MIETQEYYLQKSLTTHVFSITMERSTIEKRKKTKNYDLTAERILQRKLLTHTE